MQPAVTMTFAFGSVEAFKAVSACFDFARLSQFHYAGPVSVAPSQAVGDCQRERVDTPEPDVSDIYEPTSEPVAPVSASQEPTSEPVAEPVKRKRRTKAEMEAERAAKAAAALGTAPVPAPTPVPPAAAPVAAAPVAANPMQSVDIFGPAPTSATPVVLPAAPVAASGPQMAMSPADVSTLLRTECSRYLRLKGADGPAALMSVYQSFGVTSLKELPLEKSTAFLATIAAQIGPRA